MWPGNVLSISISLFVAWRRGKRKTLPGNISFDHAEIDIMTFWFFNILSKKSNSFLKILHWRPLNYFCQIALYGIIFLRYYLNQQLRVLVSPVEIVSHIPRSLSGFSSAFSQKIPTKLNNPIKTFDCETRQQSMRCLLFMMFIL